MNFLNSEILRKCVASVVRHLLGAFSAVLAAKGISITDSALDEVAGAIGLGAVILWSMWQKKKETPVTPPLPPPPTVPPNPPTPTI